MIDKLFCGLFFWMILAVPCAFANDTLRGNPTGNLVTVESQIISTKALMTLDVGSSQRIVQISGDGNSMHILQTVDVDVSILMVSYHRHSVINTWYDKKGLLSFVSEINEDGEITTLNGRREIRIGQELVIHLFGTIKGKHIDKDIPFKKIDFTNMENFPFVSALSREKTTWRVLNLFTGVVEMVRVTPEGQESCPENEDKTCFLVDVWSTSRRGSFFYDNDGMLAYARGEDTQGNFILRPVNDEEILVKEAKEESGGFFQSFFGSSDKDEEKTTNQPVPE